MKKLHFDLVISDNHEVALEAVKALLMTDKDTGISNESTLEQVYAECANVGLATLAQKMMEDGDYERYRDEALLGKQVDKIIGCE